ncbi:MAG: hypothetical protein IT334_01235 [Thermomicrobiales bacterium]|nr:hypothetical protein [Thermomicrobiales bacterium]
MRSINRRRFGFVSFGALLVVAALFAALAPFSTTAHEHRHVGDYEFVVGFLNEPAVSNELNGLDLRISAPVADATPNADGDVETEPVAGLETSLQAEVIFGDQRMNLTLAQVWNTPGSYYANFIPTQPGDYSFHVWGTIDGVEIDETFTAGPGTFSTVIDRTTLEFPSSAD